MLKRSISAKGFSPQTAVWIFLSFILVGGRAFGQENNIHQEWDELVRKHVWNGLVDYAGMAEDRALLDQYLKKIEIVPMDTVGNLGREERIAFWLNLYNASVIRMVLDEYPIRRFDQIPAVFDIRTIRAVGEFFSLSELRDKILRQYFRDERILTAMVSARMDSPGLFHEAFQGNRLEAQLDEAAEAFVEDEGRNKIPPGEKKIFLSPVFRQFQDDFILNFRPADGPSNFSSSETAVISFILGHLRDPEKRLFLNSGRYKISFLPENPDLNDAESRGALA